MLEEGNLYDFHNVTLVHHVNQSLRAHVLFSKDVDYIVREDKVVIIDEFTGRMMEGRRYSDGLHQALEAKEHVTVQPENQTLASITFQNYFRLYPKLAGMTGTASTEADEFAEIYKLEVVEIPTNVPVARTRQRRRGLPLRHREIRRRRHPDRRGPHPRPAGAGRHHLIEKSELISTLMKKREIPHNVLNARYHEQEAAIVAQAGRPAPSPSPPTWPGAAPTSSSAATSRCWRARRPAASARARNSRRRSPATSRRSRPAAPPRKAAGGLFVIGTERHESRRIDNQLRGRSGRQGDPGASRFFLSLEDDLMRIFGSDRMGGMLQKLGLKEGEAIVHPWINKALEKAQKKVEARNFDTRKNLLKYDDVMNDQRKEVYAQRKTFMQAADVAETVAEMRRECIGGMVDKAIPENAYPEQWALPELEAEGARPARPRIAGDRLGQGGRHRRDRGARAHRGRGRPALCRQGGQYRPRPDAHGREVAAAADLRRGLEGAPAGARPPAPGHWARAYGQRDPLNEYKSEAFGLFNSMLADLRERVTSVLMRIELRPDAPPPSPDPVRVMDMRHPDPAWPSWRWPARAAPATRRCRWHGDARGGRRRWTRTIPPPGPAPRATRPAPAAPGRSTSTATAGLDPGRVTGSRNRSEFVNRS